MINKFEGEEPLQLPHNQPSFISGVAGFISAAAALFRGSREQIDVSELEATALTCVPWAILGLFLGDDSFRYGPNRRRKRGNSGPLWKTKDGLINYGYGRLDTLLQNKINAQTTDPNAKNLVIIAPSYGDDNLLEICGIKLIDILLKSDFRVMVRPHLRTLRDSTELIDSITTIKNYRLVCFEMRRNLLMLGIILEYLLLHLSLLLQLQNH